MSAPQEDENHQHARFDNIRVDGQSPVKSTLGLFKILRAAKSFEDAIDVTSAETVIGEAEFRIQLDRARKVSDCRIAIFGRDGAKDKARKSIAASQEFVVSFGVDRRRLGQPRLFVGT